MNQKTKFFLIVLVFAVVAMSAGGALALEEAGSRSLMEEANSAYNKQDFGTAEELYKKILSSENNAEAYYRLSLIYSKKRDFKNALLYGEKAISADPNNANFYLAASRLYVESGNLGRGIELLKRSIELNPENVFAYDFMVDIIYNLGARKEWEKAEELCVFCQSNFKSFEYASWAKYFVAELYAHQRKYDKAESVLESISREKLHPKYVGMSYGLLASIYLEKRQWDKSIENAKKSIQILPENFGAMNDLGAALAAKGKYEESVTYLKKAFSLNPISSLVQNNIVYLSDILYRRKEWKLNEDLLLAAATNKSSDEKFAQEARFRLAHVYYLQGRKEESIEVLDELLQDFPDSRGPQARRVYQVLSGVYAKQRDIIKSEKYASMTGVPYYLLWRAGIGVVNAVILAFIVFLAYLGYRGYKFFRKKEDFKERAYGFGNIILIFLLPVFVYPVVTILSNLVFFQSLAPPENANFAGLLLLQFSLTMIIVACILCYLLFRRYGVSKKDLGIGKPLASCIKVGILLFIGIGLFDEAYQYILHFFKIEIPVSVIAQALKTSGNLGVIIAGVFVGSIIIPVVEEFIFRGFFYEAFKRRTSVLGGMVFTSLLFGIMHVDVMPWGFLPIVLLGMALAYLREKSGSLLAPIVFHCLNNTAALLVFLNSPAG